MSIELQRAPRCGHVWVAGIDSTLYDGLHTTTAVHVRDIGAGSCPICRTAIVRTAKGRPSTSGLDNVQVADV